MEYPKKVELTEAEEQFCEYQIGAASDFHTRLTGLLFMCDMGNLFKMANAFPDYVAVIMRYKFKDGYWQEIKEIWNNKYPHRKIV